MVEEGNDAKEPSCLKVRYDANSSRKCFCGREGSNSRSADWVGSSVGGTGPLLLGILAACGRSLRALVAAPAEGHPPLRLPLARLMQHNLPCQTRERADGLLVATLQLSLQILASRIREVDGHAVLQNGSKEMSIELRVEDEGDVLRRGGVAEGLLEEGEGPQGSRLDFAPICLTLCLGDVVGYGHKLPPRAGGAEPQHRAQLLLSLCQTSRR
mmetsp:Transcript_9682/g.23262  ORF Transcript_9682/g.23262 Transcript_9682/m.23262 type:complete len:213 (+) Transcript_9682:227-865(+)